jgi:YD repeat-containing protein
MSNCRGCGTVLDPTENEVNQGVNEILEASLKDAVKQGEICPLCGHSQAQPISHRKSIQFGLLLAALLLGAVLAVAYRIQRNTERQAAAQEALKQIESSPQVKDLLGLPVTINGYVVGQVRQDETGWHEFHLAIPVRGPKTTGVLRISGGRENGPWKFTTLEMLVPQLKKRADLITGRIVEYDPAAYQEVHTEAFTIPEYVLNNVPAPTWDGGFPCVYARADTASAPQAGRCETPVPMSDTSREVVDVFEADLRRGSFVSRQTDLVLSEAGFTLPLTRTYTSQDWMPPNKSHAFGRNTNHPYDIAPLGTRNPYTEQYIILENGDFLYFPRVSAGSGYSDAIFRHSETGTSFYKATQQWVGDGWMTKLQDGSMIRFPESYNASSLAQGAATEMVDAAGNRIELVRDGRRNLQQILGPKGGFIKFSYDGKDRIVRAENDQGVWTSYAYNAAGFLTDVVHSTGTARYYYYEDGQLTWIRDEKGLLLLHNSYDSDWVVKQTFGNGQTVSYNYNVSKNGRYAERVSVTLPDGSVRASEPSRYVSYVYKR